MASPAPFAFYRGVSRIRIRASGSIQKLPFVQILDERLAEDIQDRDSYLG